MNFKGKYSKDNPNEFVDYWKENYDYPDPENKYTRHIEIAKNWTTDPKKLSEYKKSLKKLFIWKNETKRLSGKKLTSVNNKIEWLDKSVKSCNDKTEIIEKAKLDYPKTKSGEIWNIFFLHCLDPENLPIFDQHTYRAMKFIKKGKFMEIKDIDRTHKYKSYWAYKDFLETHFEGCDQRHVDKALFAFGKFLKAYSTVYKDLCKCTCSD